MPSPSSISHSPLAHRHHTDVRLRNGNVDSTDPTNINHSDHHEKANDSPLVRFPYVAHHPSCTDLRAEQGAMVTVPLLQPSDNMHPTTGPLSEHQSRVSTPSVDTVKRRPLPTPPSISNHSRSFSQFDCVPSSPPPPYSRSLEDDDPFPMSHDLSIVAAPAPAPTTIAPEEPVIMTPPTSNEQSARDRAPYDSFLCHSPLANTGVTVETSRLEYTLVVRLPGFTRDGMLVGFLSYPVVFADSYP